MLDEDVQITARWALEQNREVYAVLGNITTAQSFGPNHLIKQGAKRLDGWMDGVEELPAELRMQLMPRAEASEEAAKKSGTTSLFEPALSPDQKAVYEVLRRDQPRFVDAIGESLTLPQARVLTALLELEMVRHHSAVAREEFLA